MLQTNWDSYGAPPIDIDCIDTARSMIELVQVVSECVPLVFPTARGGVQLEWRNPNGTEVEVDIIPTTAGVRMEHLITDASGNVLSDTETVWAEVRRMRGEA